MRVENLAEAKAQAEVWENLDRLQVAWQQSRAEHVLFLVQNPGSDEVASGTVLSLPRDHAVRVIRAEMNRIADRLQALGCYRPWPTDWAEEALPVAAAPAEEGS